MATVIVVSPANIAIAIRKAPNLIWDWVAGVWAAIPTTGVPLATQLKQLTRTTATGSLANELTADVPDSLVNTAGVWAVGMVTDGNGKIAGGSGDLIWCDTITYVPPIQITFGGVAR